MDRVPLELVTIIAETVLEEPVTRGLLERGATGYMVTPSGPWIPRHPFRGRARGIGAYRGRDPSRRGATDSGMDPGGVFPPLRGDRLGDPGRGPAWRQVRVEVIDLNHHHLRSFWVVAREGSITRASETLGVTPSR